ncbi:hypothetical protein C0993_004964 [Termitomyces sp. T159_Od127]|nr:hypothetical protein C0993_004964 [Termitomyces sp. T159_Od127]
MAQAEPESVTPHPSSPTPSQNVPTSPQPKLSKIPPFTPRSSRTRSRPASPDSDEESDDDIASAMATRPRGHQLVVRGCVTSNPIETPVLLVKNLLVDLSLDPRYDFFSELKLLVTPFSDRPSNPSSACYVELRADEAEAEDEPRVDLLEMVRGAIMEARPLWEVRWSASRKGKSDKRLSCRLMGLYPGISDRKDIPLEHLPMIRSHIERQGFKIASIFASFGGPQVSFLLPSDADRFMALGSIDVPPKVSKLLARIEPLKEIPIEKPFELVVAGARDWDQLGLFVKKWVKKITKGAYDSSRITELNSDLFVLSMTTWADTLTILRNEESFRKCFPETISPPRLLWDYNDNPLRKTSLGDQVAQGADQISDTVKALAREVRELRGEVRSVQSQQADVVASQGKIFDLISSLDQRISTTQHAFLIQGQGVIVRSQISEAEAQIGNLRIALLITSDEAKRAEMQSAIDGLSTVLEQRRAELARVNGDLASVTGTGAGTIPTPTTPTPTHPTAATQLMATPRAKRRKTAQNPSSQPLVSSNSSEDGSLPSEMDVVRKRQKISLPIQGVDSATRSSRAATHDIAQDSNITASRVKSEWMMQWRKRAWGRLRGLRSTLSSFPAFSNFRTFHIAPSVSCSSISPKASSMPTLPEKGNIMPSPTHSCLKGITVGPCDSIPILDLSQPQCRPITFILRVLIYILLFSLLVTSAHAHPASQSHISLCAFNVNSLVSPVKLALIGPMIAKLSPHIFTLLETKTRSNVGHKLPINDYEILEENGVSCASSQRGKWGLVLGIRKDIQIVSRIPISHPSLDGRVIAADLVIPSKDSSFVHRVFAVYAPCDPTTDNLSREFWPHLTDVIRQTKTSWCLLGDLNATVSSRERAHDNAAARQCLLNFLTSTNSTDLWQQIPDRNRFTDWTCRAWQSNEGGNIIDRVIVSNASLVDSHIRTDSTWIPGTDHRAIVAKVVLKSPIRCLSPSGTQPFTPFMPSPPPRIRYPTKEDKYKFALFAETAETLAKKYGPQLEAEITDDNTYTARYLKLTAIIEQAAVGVFGRNKPFRHVERKITSPLIRILVTRIRHTGGAISISRGDSRPFSYGSRQVHQVLSNEFETSLPKPAASLTEYLVSVRRALHRELYAAQKAEIVDRAQRYDRSRIT